MGGFFGVVSKSDCILELFFGTDYHSHLGTRRGGMAVYTDNGFNRVIHNIENSPFRTKFEKDIPEMRGNLGIGCISDTEPQPLLVRSKLGNFAITTVGRINNKKELLESAFNNSSAHFLESSFGEVNSTELVASLISQSDSIVEGITNAQNLIDGSMTMLILTEKGIYAARDKLGRTPLVIGEKEGAFCASFESFAYLNLGFSDKKELGAGEIVYITADGIKTVKEAGDKTRICGFLWTYYGYTTSSYEGVNVEAMRYECGKGLAKRDKGMECDYVAGIPDSGTAHAIGYANESGIPFVRPFIKYTPTWPRSFMPTDQNQRNLVAKMKLIPIDSLIRDKRLIFIDDSIVRGTQMRETVEFLYSSGAKEVHIRSSCPPIMFGCKYLSFSRSTSVMDLITRKTIAILEGDIDVSQEVLDEYADCSTEKHKKMIDLICKTLNFTSLKYNNLNDMLKSIGIDENKICTYCWNGKE